MIYYFLALLVSGILHEFGHALAAVRYNLKEGGKKEERRKEEKGGRKKDERMKGKRRRKMKKTIAKGGEIQQWKNLCKSNFGN